MPLIFIQPDDSTVGHSNTNPDEPLPAATNEEDPDAEGKP